MKIILIKDTPGIGKAGDVKDVSDGYARNFLIPKHVAVPATSEVLAKVQKEQSEHQAKVEREHERFLNFKKKLNNKTIKLEANASKNNLFAAIHVQEIANAINQQLGVELNPKLVSLEKPIKTLGTHEITIKFAKDIRTVLKLEVIGI